MITTMWLTVGLLLTIAAFTIKNNVLGVLTSIACIMAALAQLYWIFEL